MFSLLGFAYANEHFGQVQYDPSILVKYHCNEVKNGIFIYDCGCEGTGRTNDVIGAIIGCGYSQWSGDMNVEDNLG